MELKEEEKESSAVVKKSKKNIKEWKQEDSDSSVIESSNECRPNKKYCILHSKCSYSTDNRKDLHAIVINQKQRKKKTFRTYGESNKELNALIEKKFQIIKKKEEDGKIGSARSWNADF